MTDVVRPAERRDAAAIVSLWSALMENGHRADPRWEAAPSAPGILAKWASASWLARDPFPAVWIADVDGAAVGFLEGAHAPNSRLLVAPPTATIVSAWVDPAFRGRGLGRRLVEAFVDGARKGGSEVIEVSTLTLDGPANAFWHAMGFGDWRVTLRKDD